jgi:hypothetical protein
MTQRSRLLSGKVPVTPPTQVSSDRYNFLDPSQAEPSLGISANGAVLTTNTLGTRTWTTAPSLSNIAINSNANIAGIAINSTGVFWPNGQSYGSGTVYSNANVQVLLGGYSGNINVSGNINTQGKLTGDVITANTNFFTSGYSTVTTGLYWSNGAPYYGDANVQSYIQNYTGNIGSTVTGNQPYITNLGYIANATITSQLTIGANAQIVYANGQAISYSNVSVAAALAAFGAPIVRTGNLFGNGIVGGIITSNTSLITNTGIFWANGTNYSVSITGSIPSYSNANVAANVTNFLPTYTGNIGSGAGYYFGTIATAAQPNITSHGTLSSLNVNGATTLQGGTTTINGNLVVSATGAYLNDVYAASSLNVAGTGTVINATAISTNVSKITLAKTAATAPAANVAGIYTPYSSFYYDSSNNSWDSNNAILPYWTGNLNLGGPTNYWGNIYATGIVTGSLNTFSSQAYFQTFFAGSINSSSISAGTIGNIGTTLIGSLGTGAQTNITSVGTLTSLQVSGFGNIGLGIYTANIKAGTVGNVGTQFIGTGLSVDSAYIPTLNTTYANITTANLGALTGALNVQGVSSFYSNILAASGVASTSTGTGAITVTGSGGVGVGGNVTAGGLVGPLYGTVMTANQPNITTVGTLTNLTIAGNLTVQGASTIIGSQDLTINDSVINLHTFANLAALTGNDGRDIGLKLHYYDTTLAGGDDLAFVGRANDTGYLEFYTRGSEGTGNVFTGGTYGTIKTGEYIAANTTAATSSATGALRVFGGAGIAGQIYSAGINSTTGNLVTAYLGTVNAGTVNGATIGNTGAALTGATVTTTGAATLGNVITTNGIFWPNGVSYGQGTFTNFSTANIDIYLPGYQGNLSSAYTTVNNDLLVRGTANIGNLLVPGTTTLNGNVSLNGTVTHNGNLGINSGALTIYDSIIDIHTYGNLAAWASDDGKDVGIRMHYYKGADKIAFLGWENTTQTLQYLQDATETNSNISGTFGAVQFGSLTLSNTTTSTSTSTGALYVAGGAGIAGNVNAGAYYSNAYYWAANGQNILTGLSSGGGGGGGSGTSGAYFSGVTNYASSPVTDLGNGETYVFSTGTALSDPFGQTVSLYTSDWNELETGLSTLDLGVLT